MDFKMFCAMLYKRISDDYDVPQFVKDLIVMITSVPEGEWGTKKDPSESDMYPFYWTKPVKGVLYEIRLCF